MRWLKRGLWIAAWSVWVWLGAGLYLELPRTMGPPECRIDAGAGARVLGFNGPSQVVFCQQPSGQNPTIAVYDAHSGKVVSKYVALVPSLAWRSGTLHHGHYLFIDRAAGVGPGGFGALELATGTIHEINAASVMGYTAHPTDPVVAFIGSVKNKFGLVVAVYDLRAHRIIFETGVESGNCQLDPPYFVRETDKIVIAGRVRGYTGPGAGTSLLTFSYLQPGDEPKSDMFEVGPTARGVGNTTGNGRAAFGPSDSSAFEVFDFTRGQIVFARPATILETLSGTRAARQSNPALSADGRAVLAGSPQTLWEIDSERPLWTPRSFDRAFPILEQGTLSVNGRRFGVLEQWSKPWENWLPQLQYETVAHRSLSDGSLLLRIRSRRDGPSRFNADWTLGVADDGAVYSIAPLVNWSLLALCQTILALPLILLWLALLWRRKRRERRLAGAAA